MDALVPIMVVVIVGPEDIVSPFKDQVILRGSSPLDTRQVSCAMSPSLTSPDPKEKGMMLGGSGNVSLQISNFEFLNLKTPKTIICELKLCLLCLFFLSLCLLFTLYKKLCGVADTACLVGGSACVSA